MFYVYMLCLYMKSIHPNLLICTIFQNQILVSRWYFSNAWNILFTDKIGDLTDEVKRLQNQVQDSKDSANQQEQKYKNELAERVRIWFLYW